MPNHPSLTSSRRAAAGPLALIALCAALFGCVHRPSGPADVPSIHAWTWSTIGQSIEGRPILARTVGSGARRILLVGSIHGDEPWGRLALERLIASESGSFLACGGQDGPTLRIILDVNPDGTAADMRTNIRGIDLNRNFPARNFTPHTSRGATPLSEPESAVLFDELHSFNPDVVIVLHAIRRGDPFVNFDGPAGYLAERFAEAASLTDPRWTVRPEMGYATPGSLGSFVGKDRGVPILTVEFARAHNAELAEMALLDGLRAVCAALRDHFDSMSETRFRASGRSQR